MNGGTCLCRVAKKNVEKTWGGGNRPAHVDPTGNRRQKWMEGRVRAVSTSATRRAVTTDMWRDTFACVAWLDHTCDTTRFFRVLIHMCSCVWHGTFVYVPVCDMLHSYVFLCDTFIYVAWHIHMGHPTCFLRVAWLTHMCSCVWHGTFDCVPACDMLHSYKGFYVTQSYVSLRDTIRCVLTSHNQMCSYVAHSHVWHKAFTCVMRQSHASPDCSFQRTWLILMCSHVRHGAFLCVPVCDMPVTYEILSDTFCTCGLTQSYVSHDSFFSSGMTHMYVFLRVTWHIILCSSMWHASYICVSMWHIQYVAWHIHMCDTTRFCRVEWLIFMRSYVWHGTFLGVLVCDMPHTYVFSCVTWHIPLCDISDMTSHDVRHVTWLVHTCDMTHSCVWYDSLTRVTWPIHKCDMIQSYVWHDSFMRETWLIHACDMTHSYVWHNSFICMTWLIHMCDMTHSYVWHDSFICVISLIHAGDMTHSYVWYQQHVADDFIAKPWHFFISFFRVDNLALRTQEKTGSDQNIAPHRVAKMHRMSYLYRWFSAKELYH